MAGPDRSIEPSPSHNACVIRRRATEHMFRYLSALFLAVFLADLAISALETRRAWVLGSIVLKRRTSPIGYWLMTSLWLLVALGSVAVVSSLTFFALISAGPYKEHAFFSMHQAWPYAATASVLGWLALKIIRRRLFFLHHGQGGV